MQLNIQSSDGAILAGEMDFPLEENFDAIVIPVHGSFLQDRNGDYDDSKKWMFTSELPKRKLFLDISKTLRSTRCAVYRYDKRGSGKSEGIYSKINVSTSFITAGIFMEKFSVLLFLSQITCSIFSISPLVKFSTEFRLTKGKKVAEILELVRKIVDKNVVTSQAVIVLAANVYFHGLYAFYQEIIPTVAKYSSTTFALSGVFLGACVLISSFTARASVKHSIDSIKISLFIGVAMSFSAMPTTQVVFLLFLLVSAGLKGIAQVQIYSDLVKVYPQMSTLNWFHSFVSSLSYIIAGGMMAITRILLNYLPISASICMSFFMFLLIFSILPYTIRKRYA
jgi:hypothetical protein